MSMEWKRIERKRTILKPLNDLVLLEADPFEDYNKYKGYQHVVIPDQFKHGPEDRNFTGTVLALGKNCQVPVKKGDRVAWGKYAAIKFTVNRKDYYLIRDYDLLGIFENGT